MTDDFDITMACLDAIEQEVRRAKLALLQALGNATPHVGVRVNAEDCPLAKQMHHEAASVQPMTGRGVGLWDAAAALDKIVGGLGQDVRHG